jgi:transposase-like protein
VRFRAERLARGSAASRARYDRSVAIFGAASRGAVLELRCPHCGIVQARARDKADVTYRCKSCHRPFTREQGLAKAAEAAERHRSR